MMKGVTQAQASHTPGWVARKDGGGGQMLLSITNAPLLRGGKALARSTSRTMKVCTLVVVCTSVHTLTCSGAHMPLGG